jgi:hypothetical protein
MNLRDDPAPSSRSADRETVSERRSRPRVVIFDGDGDPKVEILELPDGASPGHLFCHLGTKWQVMATRTGDRVLIARRFQA